MSERPTKRKTYWIGIVDEVPYEERTVDGFEPSGRALVLYGSRKAVRERYEEYERVEVKLYRLETWKKSTRIKR